MTLAILSNTTWSLLNFRRGLIEALLAEGHEVVTLSPPDQYVARLRQLGVRYRPLRRLDAKGRNPLQDIRLVREIAGICREEAVEALFTYTPKGNIYGAAAAKLAGVRALPTVNGLGHAFVEPGMTSKLLSAMYRVAFRNLPVVFVQNPDDARQLVASGALLDGQVQLVPGSGVNVRSFAPSPLPLAPASGPNSAVRPVRFLMIARLVREKGVDVYLRAAARLVDKYPEAVFNLIGMVANNPSAIRPDTLAALTAHPRINYLGPTDNVNAAFDDCEVFVLPSYYREGIPRVLLEALAKGKPIVTTNSTGCREVVEHGQNGYLVRPRSVDSLAEACARMLSMTAGERAGFGETSRTIATLRFDERIVINTMLEYLNVAVR